MSRRLFYASTFPGKDFKKEIARLTTKEREQIAKSITSLAEALKSCSNVCLSEALKPFRPSRFYIAGNKKTIPLFEYRCIGVTRVIAAYCAERDYVWLIAATITHDHKRLAKQASTAASELNDDFSAHESRQSDLN